jgi:hypothetical protein
VVREDGVGVYEEDYTEHDVGEVDVGEAGHQPGGAVEDELLEGEFEIEAEKSFDC